MYVCPNDRGFEKLKLYLNTNEIIAAHKSWEKKND